MPGGVIVDNTSAGTKQVIPLDLDKLAHSKQLAIVRSHMPAASYSRRTGSYAFVTGRADQVNSVFGGGYNGVGLDATGVSGYLDQTANPLYVDGNIGIIKDPLGPNPQLVAATRPIPFGFPVDLAISDDGQYLYVSYQGLPTATGSGGVLVFDAKALVAQVQSSLAAQPSGSLLRTVAIDDLPLNNKQSAPGEPADRRQGRLPVSPRKWRSGFLARPQAMRMGRLRQAAIRAELPWSTARRRS